MMVVLVFVTFASSALFARATAAAQRAWKGLGCAVTVTLLRSAGLGEPLAAWEWIGWAIYSFVQGSALIGWWAPALGSRSSAPALPAVARACTRACVCVRLWMQCVV